MRLPAALTMAVFDAGSWEPSAQAFQAPLLRAGERAKRG
jgi:hypothetical protein